MSDLSKLLCNIPLKGKLTKNISLSNYTSWRTGGPAEFLYIPADLKDLSNFLYHLPSDIPITWLGLGSNTLIRDGGVKGVVIITQGALSKISIEGPCIRAEAGISAGQLARFSARNNQAGLAFMAGIPGTVGGALAMNAGCFGGETWRHITTVETINRLGEIKIRPRQDFEIQYREVKRPKEEWFVAGNFLLKEGEKNKLLQEIKTFLAQRNDTQPTNIASCGSVFKNPQNHFAGNLIESCGLKGKCIGGASVSEKHANFILNNAQATSSDIEQLIEEVKATVFNKTGIMLTPEVCILGHKSANKEDK